MFDVDGCLVLSDVPGGHDGTVLPGAIDMVRWVKESGRKLVAFTNASSQPPQKLAASLRDVGFDIDDSEMLTPAVVAADIFNTRYAGKSVLAFGTDGVVSVLNDHGVPIVDIDRATDAAAVMVGWDTEFTYPKLQAAAEALWNGADLFVTSVARTFAGRARPTAGLSGFIAMGLKQVTGVEPEVTGKPSLSAMGVIEGRLGVSADRIIVVGDDLSLESRMARSAGAIGVITTTGLTSKEAAESAPEADRPDLIVENVGQLMNMWRATAGV